jgi:ABC-type multidrug transport system fused ATPase/permease subunit
MLQTAKKILSLLSQKERKEASLLLLMVLIMAICDTIGVASVMPFISVMANPVLVESNESLIFLKFLLKSESEAGFLFSLGVIIFILLLLSLAVKATTVFLTLRFTLMRESSIGERLIARYLSQPYAWLIGHDSAEMSKVILSEVNHVIHQIVLPLTVLISQTAVAVGLLTLLILINPLLAFMIGLVLTISYILIYAAVSTHLKTIGKIRSDSNKARFQIINEAFSAPKLIKFLGLEEAYVKNFICVAESYARTQAAVQIVTQMPRFLLEAIAFGGLLVVILYKMASGLGLAEILPIAAVYAFAGYRLMPALQQIYTSYSQLSFASDSLDRICADLSRLEVVVPSVKKNIEVTFKRELKLENISFKYPGVIGYAVKNLSLCIPYKSNIGIVGVSGSGKTTIVDIILGLLVPNSGSLSIDGVEISNSNRGMWQKKIGYVPQGVYLKNASVAENIAFGIENKNIDNASLMRAAQLANIHSFIVNELQDGYSTIVGERGVILSGGQIQRIGIARALYSNPTVLIFDEATSALDGITEQAVMAAIKTLEGRLTIIVIAHRISTVARCDRIYRFEKGGIKAAGTYDELIKNDIDFRSMAGIS